MAQNLSSRVSTKENGAMNLIVYAAADYPDRSILLARLQAEVPVDRFEMLETIEELRSSLLPPLGHVLAVLLFPFDATDLARLPGLVDLLAGTRTILVLPEWNPQVLPEAHQLRPRFITSRERDFGEVTAVLRKMAAQLGYSGIHGPGKGDGNAT